MLEHIHLAVTRSQGRRLKRSPKYRGRREKWEKIRSVSLAPGLVFSRCAPSAPWGVRGLRAVPGLLPPSGGAARAGRSPRRSPLGLRCSQIPPETSTEHRNLQGLGWILPEPGLGCFFSSGVQHTPPPPPPPLPCDHSDGRQEREKPSVRFLRLFFAF